MDRATAIFVDGIGAAAATSGVLGEDGVRLVGRQLLWRHHQRLSDRCRCCCCRRRAHRHAG